MVFVFVVSVLVVTVARLIVIRLRVVAPQKPHHIFHLFSHFGKTAALAFRL
jgi:hypothetical protein